MNIIIIIVFIMGGIIIMTRVFIMGIIFIIVFIMGEYLL